MKSILKTAIILFIIILFNGCVSNSKIKSILNLDGPDESLLIDVRRTGMTIYPNFLEGNIRLTLTYAPHNGNAYLQIIERKNRSVIVKADRITQLINIVENKILPRSPDSFETCDDCTLYIITIQFNDKHMQFVSYGDDISELLDQMRLLSGIKNF